MHGRGFSRRTVYKRHATRHAKLVFYLFIYFVPLGVNFVGDHLVGIH